GRPWFCYQPPNIGRCRAAYPRFFYDPYSDRCRLFKYGGCGGNWNNFMSQRQCRSVCEGKDLCTY
ncbi:Kunitz domain-containing protein, putative, partial [Ixodes scapularis]